MKPDIGQILTNTMIIHTMKLYSGNNDLVHRSKL